MPTDLHRVVVLAPDRVIPFELGIPTRIFSAARDAARSPSGEPLYEVLACSVDGNPVRTAAGFSIVVEHGPEALASAHTVVVAAAHGPVDARLVELLRGLRPGVRIVSICTAAFVLAAAGLLDDRPATTHWHDAEALQREYPRVRVDPDVLFVDDGDVLTSAGGAAGVDLCLHLVRRDHGTEVAAAVARELVVPPWRDGGQAQYIERPVPHPADTGTAATRARALERLHEPLPLRELAADARMSVRTFTRRFRDEVGISPGGWLLRQRVDAARHLLESTDLSIDTIAHKTGLGTAASLRRHFRLTVGVSPSSYRRTFRGSGGRGRI